MNYLNRVALTVLACILVISFLTMLFSFMGVPPEQMFPYSSFAVGLVLFSAVLPTEYNF